MSDRRRINGPAGGTAPPRYIESVARPCPAKPRRRRAHDELRKIFLKTGLTPSASGSAYLELHPTPATGRRDESLAFPSSAPKLTCVVHGPRPLPRSAQFTPHILLSTHVKFAPFALRQRRGYIRDATERDLSAHLDTALRGMIIADRWPKSSVEVIITVLEGAEDYPISEDAAGSSSAGSWATMSLLASCITVASAAIADAGIDCLDLVAGGVAALLDTDGEDANANIVLDPCSSEHVNIRALCVVGYMSARDEMTEIWVHGNVFEPTDGPERQSGEPQAILHRLLDQGVRAAAAVHFVLSEAVKEASHQRSISARSAAD